MSVFTLALTYFLVANPIGNSPAIVSMIKDFDFERQRKIVLREGFFSFLLAIFFQFFGEFFLQLLNVSGPALSLTGGVLLFLTALQMIFHKPETKVASQLKQEPFLVPIATPLISGPGLMTIIMVTSGTENNNYKITMAIVIAWIGVISILAVAPYLQKIIGKRGLAGLEQVMGMVVGLIGMQMVVSGSNLFVKTLTQTS